MKRIFLIFHLLAAAIVLQAQDKQAEGVFVEELTCEYSSLPLGVDQVAPRLSWNIVTETRNWKQSAYQIIVASDLEKLKKDSGDGWNSGKVIADNNILIRYAGKPLHSFTTYYWKVKVWDAHGKGSGWSRPASWKMGVLSIADWKGQWIGSDLVLKDYQSALRALPDFGMEPETEIWKKAEEIRKLPQPDTAPAVYIRKEFDIRKKLKRATAFVCGLGLHELYMNGRRVGDEYLNPAYTDYQKTVLYNTYDVTPYIKQGMNGLGVILGNGWYNLIVPHVLRFYAADYIAPPKLLLQLYVEYADGSASIIATDSTWKYTTAGPLIYNSILGGETYDARRDMPGWSRAGYTENGWRKCLPATPPQGKLRSQQLQPVRKLAVMPAISVSKTDKGFRFDLGREICGWARIRLKGPAGTTVKVAYPGAASHTLGRYQTCYFILKGSGQEVFESRFSYNGFRYIDVEGLDHQPALSDVEGVLVATDLPQTGKFSCSDERLNQVQQILINTIRNYIVHIPNDPTREKSGWTQDIQNGFDVNAYNFDVAEMYRKWQIDFNDIIHANGYVPPVVPGRFDGHTINGPWWGGMIVYNVAKLYEYYNDEDIVKESYEAMKQYVNYLTGISKDHIIEWGLGEWMEPFREKSSARPTTTPIALTSTVAYYYYVRCMADFAVMLNKESDIQYFSRLAASIKDSYNRHFLDRATGRYSKGSQAGQLMSLKYDLTPEETKRLAIQQLQTFIKERNGHLSTGFVATPVLLTTLSDLGLSEEAYAMATKTDFPSWFDMIFGKGNSVMKETWEGGLVQMPSLGGAIGVWFYYSLAGIRQTPGMHGFKEIVIKPDLVKGLSYVSASCRTVQGRIISEWKRNGKGYIISITIPANTTARVYLPVKDADAVTEGGKGIKGRRDMDVETTAEGEIVVKVGGGTYVFRLLAE